MINTPENINIFIAYSQEDLSYLEELKIQLSVLERIGLVDKIWDNGLIEAGADWEETTKNALHNADIILLLISADFIASDYCYEQEMQTAIQLHHQGKAITLPIILRQCLWEKTPFGNLKVLPKGGFPVVSEHWKTKDEPYLNVTESIQETILRIRKKELKGNIEQSRATYTSRVEEGNQYFSEQEWAKAQEQYKEALMLYSPGFQPSLSTINQKIENCKNEIYYRINFEKGERAYECNNYKEAVKYFDQALHFKPADDYTKRMYQAAQSAADNKVQQVTSQEKEGTKYLQIKVFGVEVFKLVMAFSFIGLTTIALRMFISEDQVRFSVAKEGDKIVYLDENGKLAFETEYTDGRSFSGGIAAVKNKEGKWGYIDADNKIVIPFKYDKAWEHSTKEGLAYVKTDGNCGFLDQEGEEVIPLQYVDAASFQDGLAMVKKKDQTFAFIDKSGNEQIIGLDSVITKQFKNGEAVVVRDKRRITIDRKGNCKEGCKTINIPENDKERLQRLESLKAKGINLYEHKEYDRALQKLEEAKRYVKPATEEGFEIDNKIDLIKRKLRRPSEESR